MSKIIENFLVPLFLVISVLYAFHSFGIENNSIVLHKVYHHTSPDEGYLEKANIALYFSGNPQVQETPTSPCGLRRAGSTFITFLFPHATINRDECASMINALNNNNHASYRVTIDTLPNKKAGVVVCFEFDPHKYLINCEQFDSIGLQKGFVFRLYNKELLTQLEKTNNQPVLRTLHNEHNPPSHKASDFAKATSDTMAGKPRIVIDPGHGGRDTGAIGHRGIQEKQVCLAIGTAVGNLLEQKGCSVLMTRKNDCDKQLDERTSYANNNHADLFVSIHANYAHNAKAIGVETFCMRQQLFNKKYSHLSDAQDACVTNIMQQRADTSYNLAQSIQRGVCFCISPFHDEPIDRKVKHSISQVLLGVQIPAVLIEVGFLSHPKESQLLRDTHYQNCIARGICDGILSTLRF